MRLIEEGLVLEKEDINIRYEHQNNSNYLVIEDSSEYEDYQYKMLKRNNPEHFYIFPCTRLMEDMGFIMILLPDSSLANIMNMER